jgi:integrase
LGTLIDQDAARWPIARVGELLSCEPFGICTLRRTFGRQLATKRVSVLEISRLMGHSSVTVTVTVTVTERSYLRFSPHALERAAAVLG